jgi:hypothetical protein
VLRYRTSRIRLKEFTDDYLAEWADKGWALETILTIMIGNSLKPFLVIVWMKDADSTLTPVSANSAEVP